jgi:hypothetical protein
MIGQCQGFFKGSRKGAFVISRAQAADRYFPACYTSTVLQEMRILVR